MADSPWQGRPPNNQINFDADFGGTIGWNQATNGYPPQQQQQQHHQQAAPAAPPPYPVNGSLMPEPRFDWNVTSPWDDDGGGRSGQTDNWGGMAMPVTQNYFANFPHAHVLPTQAPAYQNNDTMQSVNPPHFHGPIPPASGGGMRMGGPAGMVRFSASPNNAQSAPPYPMTMTMSAGYANSPMPAVIVPQQNLNNYGNYGGIPNPIAMPHGLAAQNLIPGGRLSPLPPQPQPQSQPQRPTNFRDGGSLADANYTNFNPGGHFVGGRLSPAPASMGTMVSSQNPGGGFGQNSMPSAPPMSPEREMAAPHPHPHPQGAPSPVKMAGNYRGTAQHGMPQQQQVGNFDESRRGSGVPPYGGGGGGIGGQQPKSPIPDDILCAHCSVPNANYQIICVACHRPIRG